MNTRSATAKGTPSSAGVLYVVSTPIGNLDDFSPRAVTTLQQVDAIAAEDTRHSARLLAHWGVATPSFAYHDHSDAGAVQKLLSRLQRGESIALISDAGTPLIADPGFKLVREVRAAGLDVVPVPGACALIAALSVSGLPTDRFAFEGFLPAKTEQRKKKIEALASEARTLVFYEAPHRLLETLVALRDGLGGARRALLARELTKRFETLIDAELDELVERVAADRDQQRGECVVIVQGDDRSADASAIERETQRVLKILVEELSVKQASALAARITGIQKKQAYRMALELKGNHD